MSPLRNGLVFTGLCIAFAVVPVSAEVRQVLTLDMLQTHYLTDKSELTHLNKYSDVFVRFQIDSDYSKSKVKGDVGGMFSLNETGDNHVVVPQLFFSQKFNDDNVRLTVGRRLFPWSKMDEQWQQGIWQPLFLQDHLRPKTQGLTGFYLHYAKPTFQLMGFSSPIFIPNQGPSFQERNGQIYSSNRFFESPPERIEFGDDSRKINYHVYRPSTSEVVNQLSYGLWLRAGPMTNGAYAQFSYSKKPSNQLHLAIESKGKMSASSNTVATAEVRPMSVMHEVRTLEAGYNWFDDGAWASLTYDTPNRRPDLAGGWDEAPLPEAKFLALGAYHLVKTRWLKPVKLKWNYIKAWLSETNVNSEVVGPSTISNKYRFTNAMSVGGESYLVDLRSKKLKFALDYTYAVDEDGGLLAGDLSLEMDRRWELSLQFDIVGVTNEQSSSGFLTKNRGNDRVRGVVSYVF